MKISMVMVMDRKRLIGRAGGLPWHISAELKYFKAITMGKPIIMGRKTWDSIGRPLPGRTSIVVTRNADWRAEGAYCARDIDSAFDLAQNHLDETSECCVIGGAQLCQLAMPRTQRLYLTVIDHEFEGDAWLDSYDASEWQEVSRNDVAPGVQCEYPMSYLVLERRDPAG
ncbi:MAG: dihydrofolate reductase [Pseudomonadota bacterium]